MVDFGLCVIVNALTLDGFLPQKTIYLLEVTWHAGRAQFLGLKLTLTQNTKGYK